MPPWNHIFFFARIFLSKKNFFFVLHVFKKLVYTILFCWNEESACLKFRVRKKGYVVIVMRKKLLITVKRWGFSPPSLPPPLIITNKQTFKTFKISNMIWLSVFSFFFNELKIWKENSLAFVFLKKLFPTVLKDVKQIKLLTDCNVRGREKQFHEKVFFFDRLREFVSALEKKGRPEWEFFSKLILPHPSFLCFFFLLYTSKNLILNGSSYTRRLKAHVIKTLCLHGFSIIHGLFLTPT